MICFCSVLCCAVLCSTNPGAMLCRSVLRWSVFCFLFFAFHKLRKAKIYNAGTSKTIDMWAKKASRRSTLEHLSSLTQTQHHSKWYEHNAFRKFNSSAFNLHAWVLCMRTCKSDFIKWYVHLKELSQKVILLFICFLKASKRKGKKNRQLSFLFFQKYFEKKNDTFTLACQKSIWLALQQHRRFTLYSVFFVLFSEPFSK